MRYRTLRVTYKDFPKRLNRTLVVREDLDLFTLGLVILHALQATFEHYFYFKSKTQTFLPENFTELSGENPVFMTNYHLLDLGESFTLIYDTGDWYEFKITVAKKPEIIRSRKYGFVRKGAGAGIFEDNRYNLDRYFSDEISGETHKNDDENAVYMPWNIPLASYGEYDLPLDIEMINEDFQDQIDYLLFILEENDYF